jgi:transcriptional regulator with XRE-family HTH domain
MIAMKQGSDDLRRVCAALSDAIRLSGRSKRYCERKLGLSTGYLTRILAGEVQLRFNLLLDLCDLLGIPPGAFIASLFSISSASADVSRILRALKALHGLANVPK